MQLPQNIKETNEKFNNSCIFSIYNYFVKRQDVFFFYLCPEISVLKYD